jgi:hypothetical protein
LGARIRDQGYSGFSAQEEIVLSDTKRKIRAIRRDADSKLVFWLGAAALISVLFYLLVSWKIAGIGFPLDDAWIHQTYARNFAEQGIWRFGEEETGGGSTGPLWGMLLAFWYVVGLSPLWGTFISGAVLLFANGWVGMQLSRILKPEKKPWLHLGAGLLIVLEYHIVWAACSGMETLLFSLLVLTALAWMARPDDLRWPGIGLLVGVSIWVRPGGLTLLGPAVLAAVVQEAKQPGSWRKSWKLFLTFGIAFIPYLIFNFNLTGEYWPNTLYAKQAEYAALRELSLLRRLLSVGGAPFIGAAAVLIPGVIYFAYSSYQQRDWKIFTGLLWGLGYIFLYAWRLPVTYQHGRYLIPVIPIFLILGAQGLAELIQQIPAGRWRFILGRIWVGSLGILLMVFWSLGANAFARDVGVIETEMVDTALWVEKNLSDQAVIAAHDIGALGYFTPNPIIDLAGLVSPEVIPFIRDEAELAAYLDRSGVQFVVAFPDWYPNLLEQAEVIYKADGEFSRRLGHENMAVYRWNPQK